MRSPPPAPITHVHTRTHLEKAGDVIADRIEHIHHDVGGINEGANIGDAQAGDDVVLPKSEGSGG